MSLPFFGLAFLAMLGMMLVGMPIAVLEALASGLPVASTPVGEVPSLIQNGINGQLTTAVSAAAGGTLIVLDEDGTIPHQRRREPRRAR